MPKICSINSFRCFMITGSVRARSAMASNTCSSAQRVIRRALVFGALRLDWTTPTGTGGVIPGCAPLFLSLKAEGQFLALRAAVTVPFQIIGEIVFGKQPFVLVARCVGFGDIDANIRFVTLLDLLAVIEPLVDAFLELSCAQVRAGWQLGIRGIECL